MTTAKPVSKRRLEIGRERRARTRAKIIAAALDLFGDEHGVSVRIEDIVQRAGVTRATFYNHFSGMRDLRDAAAHALTHDFLASVNATIAEIDDPRERAVVATRFYLERARVDRPWAWAILNLSADGVLFGAATYRHAEQTVREGLEAGALKASDSRAGRDVILGTSLAAISSMLRDDLAPDYPEQIATHLLLALGVSADDAQRIGHRPLPPLRLVSEI